MKKGILIGIVLCLCLGAAVSKAPKYWQDIILKPEQAWIEAYGYNNESILAYNVKSLIRIAQQQEKVIGALKKELDALSDPNDVYKFIPTWPDYIEFDKELHFDKPDTDHKFWLQRGTKVYFKDPNEVKE